MLLRKFNQYLLIWEFYCAVTQTIVINIHLLVKEKKIWLSFICNVCCLQIQHQECKPPFHVTVSICNSVLEGLYVMHFVK